MAEASSQWPQPGQTLKGRSLAPNGHRRLGGGYLDTEECPLVRGQREAGKGYPSSCTEHNTEAESRSEVNFSRHLEHHGKVACQHSTSQTDNRKRHRALQSSPLPW